MDEHGMKKMVRKYYGKIALKRSEKGVCERGTMNSCCGKPTTEERRCCTSRLDESSRSRNIGYSETDLGCIPESSNGGLGCGNPVALASLEPGDIVLDLGSGMGIDCFLAAKKVGEKGNVIGVDMTPEMVEKARKLAREGEYTNVEFRLGEIETLPVTDNSIDTIISNCVINLVPRKERVFQEAFRVLKPGGKMVLSDIVLLKELPESIKGSIEAYVECLSGAILKEKYLELMKNSGFINMDILKESSFSRDEITDHSNVEEMVHVSNLSPQDRETILLSVLSISVSGEKPLT
jgi:ubiquinone/menaquinone biosynthesis C-methylase UbiE